METYFASDGNYGEWKDSTCFILPTDDFTNEHWEMIDNAADWERPIVAIEIRERLDKEKA